MKLKKYMLISMVAVTLASCGDDFLEEKMVATITQDYFETETGVEQLIVSTYDALRVTKQYQQGPFAFFTGVDNMMLNLPIMLFIQDQFGLLLVMKQRMLMDYVVSILVINCWVFILVLIIVIVQFFLFVRGKLMVNLLLIKLMQNNEWLKQCLIVPIVFI